MWIMLVSNSLHNKQNIITKHQIVFLKEKFLEFILASAKEKISASWWGRFHPFSLEP
jgi:hypothetical protein